MVVAALEATARLELRGRGVRTYDVDEPLLVSVGGDAVPGMVPAGMLRAGDYVGIRYGGDWPTAAAAVASLAPRPRYGTEKAITLPTAMTEDLAFLLGAYMSEGHTTRVNWTVHFTNSVPAVLLRIQEVLGSVFKLGSRIETSPVRCPILHVSSKRLVEFMANLGCGTRSSEKRVPTVIQQSTRPHVLAFLQGVALDAYTTCSTLPKWAICLDSAVGIAELQDLVTRLGVINAQIRKWNAEYAKYYFELYSPGRAGQEMTRLVPFLEPDKFERAQRFQELVIDGADPTDVIPGVNGKLLYDGIPCGTSGKNGAGTGRQAFRSLRDKRTRHLTRASVQKALLAGAAAPGWLRDLAMDDSIRFVPVAAVLTPPME